MSFWQPSSLGKKSIYIYIQLDSVVESIYYLRSLLFEYIEVGLKKICALNNNKQRTVRSKEKWLGVIG